MQHDHKHTPHIIEFYVKLNDKFLYNHEKGLERFTGTLILHFVFMPTSFFNFTGSRCQPKEDITCK